jgi:hypothetical protein
MSKISKTKSMRVFTRYDEVLSSDESNAFLRKLAMSHVEEIGHQATREYLTACFTNDRLSDVCDFSPAYGELTAADAINARQAVAFFAKRDDIDLGVDRSAVALQSFKDAEASCKLTNQRFRDWQTGKFVFPGRVESVLHAAQRKIASILGPVPKMDELHFRFGPGATTFRKKKNAHSSYKLGDPFACSEALVPIVAELLAEFPGWVGITDDAESAVVEVEIHDGHVEFVPKSWKTKRAIVVEPCLNGMFQLGVGDYMAKRLKKNGVDISDQTKNQRLARYGSLTGALATLDLSSASDTISRELVAHLLPLDWFTFLSFGRSPVVILDGVRTRQEKFSSMGNGFTFPLETLIFYALAFASCEGADERAEVSVYGDDIIVPSHRFLALKEVLDSCGFTVNAKKSFYFGAFRESCGKDYLLGVDIRPFYQKDRLSCAGAFLLHNFYVRRHDPARARLVRKLIAKPVRIYGPDGYGDGHLLSDSWSPKPHRRDDGWGGYIFDTYKLGPRVTFRVSRGEYVFPFYSVYASNPERGDSFTPCRRRTDGLLAPTDISVGYARYSEPRSGDVVGRLRITLPGTEGYKRVSIYTF